MTDDSTVSSTTPTTSRIASPTNARGGLAIYNNKFRQRSISGGCSADETSINSPTDSSSKKIRASMQPSSPSRPTSPTLSRTANNNSRLGLKRPPSQMTGLARPSSRAGNIPSPPITNTASSKSHITSPNSNIRTPSSAGSNAKTAKGIARKFSLQTDSIYDEPDNYCYSPPDSPLGGSETDSLRSFTSSISYGSSSKNTTTTTSPTKSTSKKSPTTANRMSMATSRNSKLPAPADGDSSNRGCDIADVGGDDDMNSANSGNNVNSGNNNIENGKSVVDESVGGREGG
ncbi:10367_t:CDS:2, partial [Entrophospora sp. SA101]